jgi:hypothetical protein
MDNEPRTPDANAEGDEVALPEQPHADSGSVSYYNFSGSVHGQGHIFGDHGIVDTYAWVVLTVPLLPFLHSFMSKAGEDAYLALKEFIRRRLKGEREGVLLEDADTHICVQLTAELPDEAFQQLLRIDPAEVGRSDNPSQSRLRWDPLEGDWVPPS